ncbi:hypothetical protein [Nocardia sp. NPDC050710]|uniref:hypothetical protein n=1 Tax=Nocardia sp. NPDC050710 TaxID=3157220 RepID=UPI0033CAB6B2
MLSYNEIEEGEKLLAAATRPPWFAVVNDMIGGTCVQTFDAPASEAPPGSTVADMICREADAALITWMGNKLKDLLRAALWMRKIQEQLDESILTEQAGSSATDLPAAIARLANGYRTDVPSQETWDRVTSAFIEYQGYGTVFGCAGDEAISTMLDEIGLSTTAAEWRDSHREECTECARASIGRESEGNQ